MAKNASEGEIQAVDHWICVPLPLELRACLGTIETKYQKKIHILTR